MYLKSLEIIGFKSFAEKTKLDFLPGMTCIVGPNGCGKSNVSDAIRWVLGETSARALRGTQMADVIFNGTDQRKPLAMAEVSITFADCEKALGTEYDEVTVSRRVYRSGEGHYFINKTPCRLKDIARLFMGTGIGTSSYSFMEQGRIDQVLSSHPEDRREIFEEASGITKFKSDKHEAIRKLEQTETNLLRLADVIREVKRQIGSLQRQAGKARTYKTFQSELRNLEIYVTRERVQMLDNNLGALETQIEDLTRRGVDLQVDVEESELKNTDIREILMRTEREIGTYREAGSQASNRLDHTRQMIELNRQRIEEYQTWSVRDAGQLHAIKAQILDRQQASRELATQLEAILVERSSAEGQLQQSSDSFAQHQQQIDSTRTHIHRLRDEVMDLDNLATRLQNRILEVENQQRTTSIHREKLSAEKHQLARVIAGYEKRQSEMVTALSQMRSEVSDQETSLKDQEAQRASRTADINEVQHRIAERRVQASARKTQVDILEDSDHANESFSGGAKLLLDDSNPLGVGRNAVLGALASHLDTAPEYRTALEAALRCFVDAIVVENPESATEVLKRLETRRGGSARLISVHPSSAAPAQLPEGAISLFTRVTCKVPITHALERLLGHVILVDTVDAIPRPVPAHLSYVTRSGVLIRGDGCMEYWMSDTGATTPLSRQLALSDARQAIATLDQQIRSDNARLEALLAEAGMLDSSVVSIRQQLNLALRTMSQKEGENQTVATEAHQNRERLETVSWELDALLAAGSEGDSEKKQSADDLASTKDKRERLSTEISRSNSELQLLEARHPLLMQQVTEARIKHASLAQKQENLATQREAALARVRELEMTFGGLSSNMSSYDEAVASLRQQIETADGQIATLEEAVETNTQKVESMRANRDRQARELDEFERALHRKRTDLDKLRSIKSDLDIRATETRMRRQTLVERVCGEYGIMLEQILQEPEPPWNHPETPASVEAFDIRVAELRTKIDAMGPVNLVAIEEYQELEERHTFLTSQEQDLVNAKEQLMEMIRKINLTTSEMFKTTFDKVNDNFQEMFAQLFNGGSAKLVLVNEEDVLECGIEIIARPPGKRLQNISLLSGGERTMTAVALLFSIYLIKPSPFCMLDELDAPLDESNIGRFVSILKRFLELSQFVVITHNRQTIAAGDILYGVTMQEKGISNIVSMKFADRRQETAKTLKENGEAPADPAAIETPVRREGAAGDEQSGQP